MNAIKTAADFKNEHQKRKKGITPAINPKYDYIKVKQYAAIVGQHIITVYKNLEKGRIEGAIKSGGTWLIPVQKEA
ncbi:MAG: hypothetical protein FWE90_08310 [Defluviitaleaceae bacterium]|nr:hypothetical protein [Defluviitaleaceae bacterium]